MPLTGGTSAGDGMYSMTASSIACTPLFLKAEPHCTRQISVRMRARAQPRLDLLDGELAVLEVLVHQLVVGLGRGLDQLLAPLRALGSSISAGTSRYSNFMPSVESSQ